MPLEIERKFLVTSDDFKKSAFKIIRIKQGFLNTDPACTIRVRCTDDKGVLTIKGKSTKNGLVRFEWETDIEKQEAESLLTLCETAIIDKKRYLIQVGGHVFEVDEFLGDNIGLLVAEVELKHENEDFKTPSWLGKEVTGQIQYYNSQLSKNPYKHWS